MSFSNIKEKNIIKKSIEDYYKSWFKKIFERGVRDAKIYLELDCIGHLAVNFALDTGYENNGIHMRGNFTEYQLRMVKLPTSEKEFVKDYKGMEVLQFE